MQPNYYLPVLLLFWAGLVHSQPAMESRQAEKQQLPPAAAFYYSFMGAELPLYNGTAHVEHEGKMEGNAYWNTYSWQTGWVVYDKVPYYNIPLKLDLIKGVLIVKQYENINKIELLQLRVDSFSLGGHTFVKLVKNGQDNLPQTGYYDQLAKGPLTLLAHRTKKIEESLKGMELVRSVRQKDAYYIQLHGRYYAIRNSNELLGYLKASKKEIQQHLKKKGLKYKRAPELTLVTIAQYYNQTHS